MAIYPGLVSKTFDHIKAEEVIKLAKDAGLIGIEWSGGNHLRAGNYSEAVRLSVLTKKAGLKVAAYGSYYRVGLDMADDFSAVLETAMHLQAPTIRVWAGKCGSSKAEHNLWELIVDDSKRIASLAAEVNIAVAFEYHANTLTDTNETAYELIRWIDHKNVFLYWQPLLPLTVNERVQGLKTILPCLKNIHVFHWMLGSDAKRRIRNPLIEGCCEWQQYVEVLGESKADHYALLEFVKDDSCEQFFEDAKTLKKLL